jgi:hypothetical protein
MHGGLKRWWREVRAGRNLDLNLLILASIVTVTLDVVGVTTQAFTIGILPPLLALVAVSQLRVRQAIDEHLPASLLDRVLETDFRAEFYSRRLQASAEWTYLGITMSRTLSTGRPVIERLLRGTGKVRVVLPDPSDANLMAMVASTQTAKEAPDQVAASIRNSLRSLDSLATSVGRSIDLRVTPVLPRHGYNGIDTDAVDGLVMVHYYEFEPPSESGPIVLLRPADGGWYLRYKQQAERIIESSTPWTSDA